MSEYLGVRAMAKVLGVSASTVTRMVQRGGLRPALLTDRGPVWTQDNIANLASAWAQFRALQARFYGEGLMNQETKVVAPYCCNPECDRDASWTIRWGELDTDYLHACPDHVGQLLEEEKDNRVYPVKWDPR